MEARLQRRIQRAGWDLAAASYETLWRAQLGPAQQAMLAAAALRPGERVLDVACGTGLVTLAAARCVGPGGSVLGTDIAPRMVAQARQAGGGAAGFEVMDAEALAVPDASFDVVLCALGLMYLPDPEAALAGFHRVLRPGGRVALAVWGERANCGWASVFGIVDAEVASDVCPLFFRLGTGDALLHACRAAGFADLRSQRLRTTLDYATGEAACEAAFVGGPVALAWARFSAATRARAAAKYLESLAAWRSAGGFRVPGEFVVVSGAKPG